MKKNVNIRRKLVIPILFTVTLILVVFAIFTVTYIRHLTRIRVESQAMDLIQSKADEIEFFFTERARVLQTFLENPFFIQWYSSYNRFRAPIKNDPNYLKIIDYINEIRIKDPTIKSIFFASEKTQEYFDHEGRYEEDGYFVKDRSWWQGAIKENRLYCELGDMDVSDSTFTATLQQPVYQKNGRFLGVCGMDILITTIENIVQKIHYQDTGEAFLIDEECRIIYFPNFEQKISYHQHLSFIDSLISAKNEFLKLSEAIVQRGEGIRDVKWKNKNHIAIYTSVQTNVPYLSWSLGLLMPKHVIETPIHRITFISSFAVLLALVLLCTVTLMITSSVVRPLNELAFHLDEIANRKSDLTRLLPVRSNDAIGKTAKNFNKFISQIRTIIASVIENTKDVVDRITQVHHHSADVSDESNRMSSQTEEVAKTSREMLATVDELMDGVRSVANLSRESNKSVSDGQSMINDSIHRIEDISSSIIETYEEMVKLRRKSEEVQNTVQVIGDISDQISMLSLNASIEASRAGESGRGFSVVANEIKKLSQSTAQANRKTFDFLDSFRKDIQSLYKRMIHIRDRISEEIKISKEIIGTFQLLHGDVEKTNHAIHQIEKRTERQVALIRIVDKNIQHISGATRNIARRISQSFDEITKADSRVKELQKSTETFKIE